MDHGMALDSLVSVTDELEMGVRGWIIVRTALPIWLFWDFLVLSLLVAGLQTAGIPYPVAVCMFLY